jgi:hypothetical protein
MTIDDPDGHPALSAFARSTMMKFTLAPVLALALAISTSTAYAGGPVVVVEEPEVVAEKPTSGAILPLLLVGIALCVALCGSDDDDDPVPEPEAPIQNGTG